MCICCFLTLWSISLAVLRQSWSETASTKLLTQTALFHMFLLLGFVSTNTSSLHVRLTHLWDRSLRNFLHCSSNLLMNEARVDHYMSSWILPMVSLTIHFRNFNHRELTWVSRDDGRWWLSTDSSRMNWEFIYQIWCSKSHKAFCNFYIVNEKVMYKLFGERESKLVFLFKLNRVNNISLLWC